MQDQEMEALRLKKIKELAELEQDFNERMRGAGHPVIARSLKTQLGVLRKARLILESDDWVTLKNVVPNRGWLWREVKKKTDASVRYSWSR